MKMYCVVYTLYGIHYRFRGYYKSKIEARRDCRETMGIKNKNIIEVYEEEWT